MNASAGRLTQNVVLAVVATTVASATALAAVAPRFLLLDPAMLPAAMWHGLAVAGVSLAVSVLLIWLQMRRLRFALRALGLGARWVEPEELEELDRTPWRVTMTALATTGVAILSTLLPPLRPAGFDLDSSVSLALLSITIGATASLPLYVYVRGRVARAVQLAPDESVRELMVRVERSHLPALRVSRRTRLAVLAPVGLVGIGIALLAHAHVLAFEARGRLATAVAMAQGALEQVPGPVPDAGEQDAAIAAAAHGLSVRLSPNAAPFHLERQISGRVIVTMPLDVGHATISFDGTTMIALSAGGIAVALIALLIAAALGGAAGRSLADDLAHATRQVRLLGTEEVLRGAPQIARPARYQAVAGLGEAIERLAERFRLFAETQEQAIAAREAAQRMRGLLFAAVSHDLKSPLNSVLGFADLIDARKLSSEQRESLEVIRHRGAELLTLIQTILDAARVEAGQLVLDRSPVAVDTVVFDAVSSAREMSARGAVPVVVDLDPGLPEVEADVSRLVEALAALIRHALKTSPSGEVLVTADLGPGGREVIIGIDAPSRMMPAASLARLLLPGGENTLPRELGGLALGLSLAHSLLVLHGGDVEVSDSPRGVLLRARIPARLQPA